MFKSNNEYLEKSLNQMIDNKEPQINKQTLNLIISSYLEINRTYTNSKPQIELITLKNNNVIVKGCQEVQIFKINDFLTYFKTEVLPNMENTDFIRFLELMGGL